MKHIVEFTTDETEADFIECLQESLYDDYGMSGEFKVVTATIDYNDGKWHPIPGVRPETVHEESAVEMVWRTGAGIRSDVRRADSFVWAESNSAESIAFRVVAVYQPTPAECWANVYSSGVHYYSTKEDADKYATSGRINCLRMVEVRE